MCVVVRGVARASRCVWTERTRTLSDPHTRALAPCVVFGPRELEPSRPLTLARCALWTERTRTLSPTSQASLTHSLHSHILALAKNSSFAGSEERRKDKRSVSLCVACGLTVDGLFVSRSRPRTQTRTNDGQDPLKNQMKREEERKLTIRYTTTATQKTPPRITSRKNKPSLRVFFRCGEIERRCVRVVAFFFPFGSSQNEIPG